MSAAGGTKAITPPDIRLRKGQTPLVCLRAYSTPIAKLADRQCDIGLVGDSVGMGLNGLSSTLGRHPRYGDHAWQGGAVRARAGALGRRSAIRLVRGGAGAGFRNAARLMAEAGCAAVKLDDGENRAATIRFLTARGVPVMAHVG
ncbi:3-methyl-2-oxobutanoate hydroxymethyltransferase [Mesorhizobium caraganae]